MGGLIEENGMDGWVAWMVGLDGQEVPFVRHTEVRVPTVHQQVRVLPGAGATMQSRPNRRCQAGRERKRQSDPVQFSGGQVQV